MAQAAVSESIKLSKIRPPFYQMRKDMGKPEEIEELKHSIKERGLENAIKVRPVPKDSQGRDFEIVTGRRRYMALQQLGFTELIVGEQVKITPCDDQTSLERALDENLRRKDITAVEEAEAYYAYVNEYGYGGVSELAKKLGVSHSHISDRMSILNMDEKLVTRVTADEKLLASDNSKITPSHAEAISRLDTESATLLADEIGERGITVKQTQQIVSLKNQGWEIEHAVQRVLFHPEFVEQMKEGGTKPYNMTEEARSDIEIALGKALHEVDAAMNRMPEGEEHAVWQNKIRYPLHQLVDQTIKIRKQYRSSE